MRRVVQVVAATALLAQVAAAFSGVCYLVCLAGACSGGTAEPTTLTLLKLVLQACVRVCTEGGGTVLTLLV
jgi:hypothetical protein